MRILFALTTALLLAGCTADPEISERPNERTMAASAAPPRSDAAPPALDPNGIRDSEMQGKIGLAIGPFVEADVTIGALIPILPNASKIQLVLNWSSLGERTDLDFVLSGPKFDPANLEAVAARHAGLPYPNTFANYGGHMGLPDSPSRLDVQRGELRAANQCDAPPCEWRLRAYVDGVGSDVRWTAKLRVWHDPPGGSSG